MNKEIITNVKEEIQKLSPLEQETITLRIWEGMQFNEIASLQDQHIDTVKKCFYRSVEKVKQKMKDKNYTVLRALPALLTAMLFVGAASSALSNGSGFMNLTITKETTMTNITQIIKSKYFVSALVGVTLLAVGTAAVVVSNNKKDEDKTSQIVATPTPTSVPTTLQPTQVSTNTIVPTLTPTPVDPYQGWSTKTSSTCNVNFPVPPKQAPYIEGPVYWRYQEMDNAMMFATHMSRVIYSDDPQYGSGNVTGDVEVFCAKNTQGYTTESLYQFVENKS